MDTEGSHTQESEFAHSPWVDMGSFPHTQQHSPPLDYHGFGYGVVPLDSAYGVSIPPPYASLPLTLPSSSWPSQLTPQSQYPEGSVPPEPIPPPPPHPPSTVSPPPPAPPVRKSSTSSSTPRRTLTDEDRRRMCLYHEEHKTAKQTDIGGKIHILYSLGQNSQTDIFRIALFGVERR
ncbi:hypothetical protein BDV59DRAFT_110730 [Aspergillus ambiguus]|uniref:uncharacterized protein n=1 Tax=Aspergillus ambiguus TaxID=176160 RepID=UPI003CCDD754